MADRLTISCFLIEITSLHQFAEMLNVTTYIISQSVGWGGGWGGQHSSSNYYFTLLLSVDDAAAGAAWVTLSVSPMYFKVC